jgi:outer membrane protein OmpA-like peptidoglycan-associated protein
MPYSLDDDVADSSVSLIRWVLPALALSLILHGALFFGFSRKILHSFETQNTPRLVPRAFRVNRLQVDEKLLEPQGQESKTLTSDGAAGGSAKGVTQFDGSFEEDIKELRATPQVSTPQAPDFKEKPTVDTQAARNAASKAEAESALVMDKELSDARQKLINEKPGVTGPRPKLATGNRKNPGRAASEESGDGNISGDSGIPSGFSNLDELLSGSGRVGNGTAPILMPTDLLFEFDSADLREGATASLQKLGRLIQRNPQAVFKVEGYTDSFGSDEYNMDLSQRRAETVKNWLVQNMNIDPGRIQAKGFGKTHLLVPGDRSVEEQQLNRRVEIVIRAKG